MISNKSIIFLSLIIAFMIIFSVQDSYADNRIKQIIKIEEDYPANVSSADYTIEPELTDIDKTFVIMSFSHTGEQDTSDEWRGWEIIDNSTLRVYGESGTATGNLAEEFIAYIIEYEGDIVIQHSSRATTASEAEGEKSVTISSVNTTNTMVISKGHREASDDVTIGSEELERIRLLTSTTWGWFVGDTPNTARTSYVDVVDWNQDNISVQRGIVTLSNGASSTTVTPSTAVDRTRTMLLVTYACGTGCATSEAPDDIMLRATLNTNNPAQIVITRVGTEDDMNISWSLIEFPANFATVEYNSVTLGDGTAISTDTLTSSVVDFDKSIAMSTVGTPFGWGGGSASSTVDGAIDRGMVDIELIDNNLINVERGDSTGTNIIEYEVIQFLEPVFTENAQGTNNLEQIVKVEGTYSGSGLQDFTISPALTNTDKAMIFMSMNSSNSNAGSSFFAKNWEILDENTLRIWGTEDGTNQNADFIATIVEFDNTSPIFTQFDQLQYPPDLNDGTQTLAMSTVNTTNSFILGMGQTVGVAVGGDVDSTIGDEEITRITLTGSTSWVHETDDPQDIHQSVKRAMITDWNENDIFVQRGTGSMAGTSTSVTPSTGIDREDSILIISYVTTAGATTEQPNDSAISATLDGSNNISIQRNSAGSAINFAWQIITFPEDFISVQHGVHSQSAGQENQTTTVTAVGDLTNSFAIGTVGGGFTGLNIGRGSSSVDSDFDSVMGKIELENSNTVRFTRGDDTGTWDVGYQVIEFLTGQEFNVTVTDTASATENQDLIINKTAVDFSSIIDLSNDINITKPFVDVTAIIDQINTERVRMIIILDTVNGSDFTILNTTKSVQDVATVFDQIDIERIRNIELTDTVITDDEISLTISFIPPPPSGGGVEGAGVGQGSGGTIAGVPKLQRLQGLLITSEPFYVKAGDNIPSDFTIQWFGKETSGVQITKLNADASYINWFQFSSIPDPLDFDETIDTSRTINDPTRFKNIALDDFVLTVPPIECRKLTPFDTPVPCVDQKLYEIPVEFEFTKAGLTFHEVHTVIVDARVKQVECDLFCQIVTYLQVNWWWLLAIILLVGTVKLISMKRTGGIRVIQRVRSNSNYFTSFDAKPRKKFKRSKR